MNRASSERKSWILFFVFFCVLWKPLASENLLKPLASENWIAPDETIQIPMRDGASLPTDIYLPYPEATALPALLIRTPAGRRNIPATLYIGLAKAGYLLAIQDTRNIADSSGKTMPCLTDGWGALQDGYDAVEWLAKSPLTNGQVGTLGVSALGIAQLMLAPTAPPSLKAQYIQFAAGSIYHDAAYPWGQLQKDLIENWLSVHSGNPEHLDYLKKEQSYSPFWAIMNSHEQASKVTVPALFIAGWFDVFLEGTIEAFQRRQKEGGEGAKGRQKLVIGPWTHFWPHQKMIGDFPIPESGMNPPYDISPLAWFGYYLQGKETQAKELPTILYYVTGPFDGSPSTGNLWKEAPSWPPPFQETSFYLGHEGRLTEKMPTISAIDSLFYDPELPTITLGGRNLFLEAGPKDQRTIEERSDLLVYTTSPFEEDFEIGGPVEVLLYFSTSALDTDISLRLTDVYPDGRSILLADATLRLAKKEEPFSFVEKEAPHEVKIDLHSLAHVFAKGHRVRISIAGSNYPRFEKSLNLSSDEVAEGHLTSKIATNRIHFGPDFPSRLTLPKSR